MAFAELSGGQTPMEAARGAARGSRAGPAAAALGALAGRAGARWGPAAAGAALLWARLADAEYTTGHGDEMGTGAAVGCSCLQSAALLLLLAPLVRFPI